MNKESKKLGRGLSSLLSPHNNRNDNLGDKTFLSIAAIAVERLMAVVVFPTPPFWFAIEIILVMF